MKTEYRDKNSQSKTGKYFLLIIAILALIINTAYSQFTWQRTYNSPVVLGDDEGYGGCAADGSNFYVVGSTGAMTYQFFILKLKENGDTIWTRTFASGGGYAKAVVPSGDGGCVLTGQRGPAFTIKISKDGDILWDKTYQNGGEAHDIARTNDSGYVLCGGFFSGYICKIDTSGNLQWERFYNDAPQDFHTIDLAIDGGYIVGGRKYIGGNWKAYLMKISGNGIILWEKYYSEISIVPSIVTLGNCYCFISAIKINGKDRNLISKIDNQGNHLDSDTIFNASEADYYGRIVAVNENKIAFSCQSYYSPPYRYYSNVHIIDSNLVTTRRLLLIPNTNSLYLRTIIVAPNTNADDLISMGYSEPNNPADLDVYVVRLDSSLTPPPPISVNTISSETPIDFELFQNYPNPFNGTTKINFSIKKRVHVQIKIFDILGREVGILVSESLNPGVYSKIFSSNTLGSGVYFYQLTADNKVISTHKMILIK